MSGENFIEVDHAREKVFEGKIKLKEMITERACQTNGMASDPSCQNMGHEHSKGRCLDLAE